MNKLLKTVFKSTAILVVFFVFCGQVTSVGAQVGLVDDGASKVGDTVYLEGVPLERIIDSDIVQVHADPLDETSPLIEKVKIEYVSDEKPEIKPNEILESRTPNTQTFDNRDGTYTYRQYFEDVFTTDGLEWRYLDYKYTTQAEFDKAFELAPLDTSFFQIESVCAATSSATSTVADDARIVQNAATTNYGSDTEGLIQSKDAGRNHRQVYRFTLPSDTEEITQVRLWFNNTYGEDNGGNADNLEIHQLTQTNWVEGEVTWNNYATGQAWSTAGGDFNASVIDTSPVNINNEWYYFDLMGGGASNPLTIDWGDTVNLLCKWDTESVSSAGTYMRPNLSENATAALRPYVEVTYTVEGEPEPEPEPEATSTNEVIVDMPYTQELTMITAMTVIYGTTTGTSTPLAVEYTYYQIPLIAWLIIAYLLINSFWFIYAHVKDYDRRR